MVHHPGAGPDNLYGALEVPVHRQLREATWNEIDWPLPDRESVIHRHDRVLIQRVVQIGPDVETVYPDAENLSDAEVEVVQSLAVNLARGDHIDLDGTACCGRRAAERVVRQQVGGARVVIRLD